MRISNFPEHKAEVQVVTKVQPVMEYIDRVVLHEVKVPETIVIQKEANLDEIHNKLQQHERTLVYHDEDHQAHLKKFELIAQELEMQRQALVALKVQRDIDRRNRLRLLKRLKKEKQKFTFWNLIKKMFNGSKSNG